MTAQMHEGLILDGEVTSMALCPPLPVGHPRIYELDSHLVGMNTACWRGYQGTWEIKESRFYLVALRGRFQLREGEPILADWFSGTLRVPKGEMILYVHMGFGSVYEQEVHIKIKRGLVVETRTIDNRGKEHDGWGLRSKNLPGGENRFSGDSEL